MKKERTLRLKRHQGWLSKPKSCTERETSEQLGVPQLESLSVVESTNSNISGQNSDVSGSALTSPLPTTSTQDQSAINASSNPIDPCLKPQDGLLEVLSTPDRGLSVFTRRKIKAGTLILAENPLIALSKAEENNPAAIEREFSLLSRPDQKYYLKLFDAEKSRMSRVVSIYYSNCYNCEGYKMNNEQNGGSAVGTLASRLNHSCIPNVQFSYHEASNEMRFFAIRDIPRGKELLSNYDKALFEVGAKRQRKQMMYYGFRCGCEACVPGSGFWRRSDGRRKGMFEAMRAVQECEKQFLVRREGEVVTEAIEALTRLEALLAKESLVGVPLANTYRSMAKWSERGATHCQDEVIKWKVKELQVCTIGFGKDGQRTKDIEARLRELRGD